MDPTSYPAVNQEVVTVLMVRYSFNFCLNYEVEPDRRKRQQADMVVAAGMRQQTRRFYLVSFSRRKIAVLVSVLVSQSWSWQSVADFSVLHPVFTRATLC